MKPEIWKIIKGPHAGALPVICIDETKTHYQLLTELPPPMGTPRTEPRVRIVGVEKTEAKSWYEPARGEPIDVIAKIYLHHASELGASVEALEVLEGLLGPAPKQRAKAIETGLRDTAPFEGAKITKPAVPMKKLVEVMKVVDKATQEAIRDGMARPTKAAPQTIKKPSLSRGAPAPKSVAPQKKYGW